MRLACIGNSHLASLKQGWVQIEANFDGIELTFFGQRNMGLYDLRATGAHLVAGTEDLASAFRFTSAGRDSIDTSAYDAFVLYGMWLRAFFYDSTAFYSQKVITNTLQEVMGNSLSVWVLRMLAKTCEKPIYVGHDPLPTAQNAKVSGATIQHYRDGITHANTAIFQPLGACLIAQPTQTITPQVHTDPSYLSGATRLAIGDELDDCLQPQGDPYDHMNGRFGALWLQAFLEQIRPD